MSTASESTARAYNPNTIKSFALQLNFIAHFVVAVWIIGGFLSGGVLSSVLNDPTPLVLGLVGGAVLGYLTTLFLRAFANLMLCLHQIELNTRTETDTRA